MGLPEKSLKRILVVDDERPIVELLTRRLQNWGYEVLATTDAREGFKLAEREYPDLILLDIRMPGMNGRELCVRLRGQAALSRIPVIFLTALGLPEQIEEGFKVGPDDYLLKPFRAGELKERMENLLRPPV